MLKLLKEWSSHVEHSLVQCFPAQYRRTGHRVCASRSTPGHILVRIRMSYRLPLLSDRAPRVALLHRAEQLAAWSRFPVEVNYRFSVRMWWGSLRLSGTVIHSNLGAHADVRYRGPRRIRACELEGAVEPQF